jgi:hypothetical protein
VRFQAALPGKSEASTTFKNWRNAMKMADILKDAHQCPLCGNIPEWERDGKFLQRWRLNCCHINSWGRVFCTGKEADAIIAWNSAVDCENDAIAFAREERELKARRVDEDIWVDKNLPEPE